MTFELYGEVFLTKDGDTIAVITVAESAIEPDPISASHKLVGVKYGR